MSTYFIQNTYKLPAPHNILNLILLHFTRFHTLFQITLLPIPPLPIYPLLNPQPKPNTPLPPSGTLIPMISSYNSQQ
ncbi:hydrogen gas-evolving membrane-bound hydrogenase subunit E, partial [Bacillus pumilus]|uniref:hydrogen gas-evolving membrane-bound hydrogenase subunit E n=1 Tax=Bacillus pumilus TaxID=1408 RepID=UPI0037043CC9